MSNGIIIRVSGVQVPPPLPKIPLNQCLAIKCTKNKKCHTVSHICVKIPYEYEESNHRYCETPNWSAPI